MQHDHTLNPITALASVSPKDDTNYLLAAEGVYLKFFDLTQDSPRLIAKCQVFNSQTVHGIIIREGWNAPEKLQAVVWGGTSLVLLNAKTVSGIISGAVESIASQEQAALDWILDVALSPDSQAESCVFVTAHNETVRATKKAGTPRLSFEKLDSPSRSILYSAHLTFDSSSCVTIAAGTVFGEIIVWQCYPDHEGSQKPSRVLHTFTGHEGSIFGVNISTTIVDAKGTPARYLASCSDDRTIRVWDITSTGGDGNSNATPYSAHTARETGFGPNHKETDENANRCVAVVMAHSSRIWRVQFCLPSSDEVDKSEWINILSFGEDSDSQQWCLKQDASGTATLEHVQTSAFHTGKHIWSAAMGKHSSGGRYLATGGADGTIALSIISLKHAASVARLEEESSKSTLPTRTTNISELGPQFGVTSKDFEMSVQDILRDLPGWKPEVVPEPQVVIPVQEEVQESPSSESTEVKPKKKKAKPIKVPTDAFNRYAFVGEDEFLVITTFGKVLLATTTNKGLDWKGIQLPEGCENDLRSYAIMVSAPEDGVAFLAGANGNLFMYSGGKITLAEKMTGKVASIFVAKTSRLHQMATFLGSSTAVLNSYEVTENGGIERNDQGIVVSSSSVIQLSPGFVVTSMATTTDLLILGSRHGVIDVYSWNDLQSPLTSTRGTSYKSQDAITSIIELPRTTEMPQETSNILLACRNGTYTIISITSPASNSTVPATINPLHHASPPLGQIESVYTHQNAIFLSGFRSKRFIVWNETLQREVASIECGGAHRSYATAGFSGLDRGGKFVYTKASKMYLRQQQRDSHTIAQRGGHGREIKACAVSQDGKYFATGAEDTTIRIWRYEEADEGVERGRFVALATVQKHTAGIQALRWHGHYLVSSGGNEEFFIWAITPIPAFGIGVLLEASCPEQTPEQDLRVMAFDISPLPSAATDSGNDDALLITLAFSDSTFRTYAYGRAAGFTRLARAEYTSACLMQVRHVVRDGELHVLTAATDGYLALWRVAGLSELAGARDVEARLLSRHRVHQSAVKCLDLVERADGLLVATGGDDNAVAVTVFGALGPRSVVVGDAHAAAVTALVIVRGEEGEGVRLVSSGNDQRVLRWGVEDRGVGLWVEGDVFTSIADVADVDVLRSQGESKVLVVGNGMDVWGL